MTTAEQVEQAAIEVATAYATANGYADDRRAVGLVLAGMAIASYASPEAQSEILRGYFTEFPQAESPMRKWARRVSRAAPMTAERDTARCSCPACGGPAQSIADATCPTCDGAGWTARTTADPLPSGEPGEPYQVQQTCDDCGGAGRLPSLARHVALPNIDEDLGGGWVLSGMEWSAVEAYRSLPAWSARGWKPDGGAHSFEVARADTPAAAYLALRTAIEKRP